ncbi:hypothetical protein R1sor_005012 [Riccia sorocarpa]|uniref:RING-type domain-containing protein n=1 Tax=Riccia sorocarpa TaxID=122646 RepID=A0ABD3HML8_9MARC
MTRPPRPKYPSDSHNYHEIRKPGHAHTVRLPEELLEKYTALKNALGPKKSHADVIRFLWEAAEPAISSILQEKEDHVVLHWTEEVPSSMEPMQHDSDGGMDDETMSNPDESQSDIDIALESADIAPDSEEDDPELSCCFCSQAQSNMETSVSAYPDASYPFWLKGKVDLEKDHGIPDVTGKLYHATLCAGMTHQCLESMCAELGLRVPRRQHFLYCQRGKRRNSSWISAALEVWDESKGNLQQELLSSGKPLVLYVDCSRSLSPVASQSIQPDRKGKKKVDEGAAANLDHKGKRKVDEQSPTKKKKRSDDSDDDSNESNHEQEEAVQYTHFDGLGKSEREKKWWRYMDKFIKATVQDQIEKRERELKKKIGELQRQVRMAFELVDEQEAMCKLVSSRDRNLATLVASKFKKVRLPGHPKSIAKYDRLNFLIIRNEKPVYLFDYDGFLDARKIGLEGSEWETYMKVKRDNLDVKCPMCQEYIGLLHFICPGTCACKYHITCFWPGPQGDPCECGACKVPFASRMYEYFNTRYIPPASQGVINPDTGELELDAYVALDNEVLADVMVGRHDSFGPNNIDRARQSDAMKLWKHLVHKFLQIWHHGNGEVKFHTGYMKEEDQSLITALEDTYNRLQQELGDEGRNSGLHESYIERMVGVFNNYINKNGDPNVKLMVDLLDYNENDEAARPSTAPVEISSNHDEGKGR